MSKSLIGDTIIALSTPPGAGAIAVVRLSGEQAISVTNDVFYGKDLDQVPSHTLHFGTIRNDENEILDEVVVSVYKTPKSYTKENVIEISTHGSDYIVQQIITLFLSKGIRLAEPGEFTKRAFLNGGLDLVQAEAVGDLIASNSEASHQSAMHQMRGGFSDELKELRKRLIKFASLVELELDFGEEDVEFADRSQLEKLVQEIKKVVDELVFSFQLGNVLKNGIPVAIIGKPNAGKSTLLNTLLNEEKAIVSEIAGTTRDFIEDELVIEGFQFRFIDTAGIRETTDVVEAMGVQRSLEKMEKSALILYIFDAATLTEEKLQDDIIKLKETGTPYVLVGNKSDLGTKKYNTEEPILSISALQKDQIEDLKNNLVEKVKIKELNTQHTVITNMRHYDSLSKASTALGDVLFGLDNGTSGDLLAMDIRQVLHYIGEITGQVSTDDLLESIFRDFCIGK
ncbi:MAG: tRNA uridine-5-carboxymethylaminomethyl(34) synthesis GTPase MnmE [Cyclobacteriaceae bacterium]